MNSFKFTRYLTLMLISILALHSVAGNLAAASNMKLDTENNCFYGSNNDLITILGSTIDEFSKAIQMESNSEYKALSEFATSLGKLRAKHSKNNLGASDVSGFKSQYSSIINSNGLVGIDTLLYSGNFSKIIDHLRNKVANIFSNHAFYTAEDSMHALRYMVVKSYLEESNDKSSCVSPKDIQLFDKLKNDLNQQNVEFKDFHQHDLLNHETLYERYNLVFSVLSDRRQTSAGSLVNITNKSSSANHIISVALRDHENKPSVEIKVGNKSYFIALHPHCVDFLVLTLAIEKEYDGYLLHVSVRQWLGNRRDHFSVFLDKAYIEGATIKTTDKITVAKKLDLIRCSEDPIAVQEREIETVTQYFTPEHKALIDSVQRYCYIIEPECDENDVNGDCYKCKSGYVLYQGKCYLQCPNGSFTMDYANCISCSDNCGKCEGIDACIECENNTALINGECVNECPSGTMPVTDSNGLVQCVTCTPGCNVCGGPDNCEICSVGFLYEGKCIELCPEGTYANYDNSKCISCVDNCGSCTGINNCVECEEGYHLYKNECWKKCPDGSYTFDEKTCYSCPDKCGFCPSGKCEICEEGFTMDNNGNCVTPCLPGSVQSNDLTCVPCEEHCLYCPPNDLTLCLRCDSGHYLSEIGKCIEYCPEGQYANDKNECVPCVKNCGSCNNNTTCEVCEDGYLMVDGQCVKFCPNGYFMYENTCIKCHPDKKCKTCFGEPNGNTECKSCPQDLFLEEGECKEKCELASYKYTNECIPCPSGCNKCNHTGCVKCEDGYLFKDGECVVDCLDGYTANGNLCAPCESTDCTLCGVDLGICEKCLPPKVLLNSECVTVCPPSTYKKGDFCLPCEGNCGKCDTTTCFACLPPSVLQDGKCIEFCKPGYTAINNKCVKCEEDCLECNSNLVCVDCLPDDYLFNGKCYKNCPPGTFENPLTKECERCELPCNRCEGKNSCVECKDNMVVVDGKCTYECKEHEVKLPNGDCVECKLENCKYCGVSLANCLECEDGYVELNGVCVKVCPDGTLQTSNNSCERCEDNCLECPSNPALCEKCEEGTILYEGKCIVYCPPGHHADSSNTYCVECPTGCNKCNHVDECTECTDGKVLYQGKCMYWCPLGYYVETIAELALCKPCVPENCNECDTSGNFCIKCIPPLILMDDKCVEICPDNTRKTDKGCIPCVDKLCKKCDSDVNLCQECVGGHFKYQGKCMECPDRTYPNQATKTCEYCEVGCGKCFSPKDCYKCDAGYFLDINGKCVKECAPGYTKTPNGLCVKCEDAKCIKCSNLNVNLCLECKDGLYLNQRTGICEETCPDGTFKSDKNMTCEECHPTCLTCNNAVDCKTCPDGLVYKDNKCVELCPAGHVKIGDNCEVCQTGVECLKCSPFDTTKCIDCPKGLIPLGDRCVEFCPDGTLKLPNETCELCPESCLSCDNVNTCNKCLPPKVLQFGNCVEKCGEGYVEIDGECGVCTPGCNTCSSNMDCLYCAPPLVLQEVNGQKKCVEFCKDGYFLDGSACEPCKDTHCTTCSNKINCFDCENPYVLINNIECVIECPTGYTKVDGECVRCEDKLCEKCNNPYNCYVCEEGTYLLNGKCVKDCPAGTTAINNECVACEPNCMNCPNDSLVCLACIPPSVLVDDKCLEKCPEGTVSINNECKECKVENCKDCFGKDLDICKECIPPYYLTFDGKSCIPDGCKPNEYELGGKCNPCINCETCNVNGCVTCEEGLELIDGECVYTACPPGYTKVNGKCVKCQDKNCKTCQNVNICDYCLPGFTYNPITKKCEQECPKGHYVKDRTCLPCEPNCTDCLDNLVCVDCEYPLVLINGSCTTECPNGYVNINGECTQCQNETCKSCFANNLNKCDRCLPPFKLKNGECVPDCEEEYFAKNAAAYGLVCTPCVDNCGSCNNDYVCITCLPGYYLYNEKCIQDCPEGTIVKDNECVSCEDSKCTKCETGDLSYCVSCLPPFVNDGNGSCVLVCPNGQFVNDLDQCEKCKDKHCNSCSGSNNCVLCEPEYNLIGDICVKYCPDGYTALNGECKACEDSKCKSCNPYDTDVCYYCEEGILFDDKCVEFCPKGYKVIQNKCVKCDITCSECNSTGCIDCKSGFNLENGKCVNDCEQGYSLVDGECVKCTDDNCSICDGKIKCLQCVYPYVLYNNKCVEIEFCPDGTFPVNGSCETCVPDCKKCLANNECEVCESPKVLIDGFCVNICPNGTNSVDGKCVECKDKYCAKCHGNNNEVCDECLSGFNHNGECVEVCPYGNFPCSDTAKCIPCNENCGLCYDDKKCEYCVKGILYNGQCIEMCPSGYIVENNKCVKCTADCDECLPSDLSKCTKCKEGELLVGTVCVNYCPPGTFVKIENGRQICKECSVKCKTCYDEDNCIECKGNQYLMENGTCQDLCPNGYTMVDNKCVRCTDVNCVNCDNLNVSTCFECEEGFTLIGDICVKECGDGYYKDEKLGKCLPCNFNCNTCFSTLDCVSCAPGTYVNDKGFCDICLPPKQIIDGKCTECKAKDCQTCLPGKSQECKVCETGFVLVDDKCVKFCPDGYTKIGNKCEPCSLNCGVCDNNLVCLFCKPPSKLMGDKCVESCPPGTVANDERTECVSCVDKDCIKCNPNATNICIVCPGNTIPLEGKCVEVCPEGYYQSSNKKCEKCEINCKVCNDENCYVCEPGYYLNDQGKCVSKCPAGSYESASGKCVTCSTQNCSECNPEGCVYCYPPLKLTVSGECKAVCEDGSFPNKNGKCEECDNGCIKCDGTNMCVSCIPPLVLHKGSCVMTCPPNQTNNNGICETCKDQTCIKCEPNQPGYCLVCPPPSKMLDGVCVQECPYGTFANKETNKCESCPDECEACKSKTECIQCPEGFMFENGECKPTCPVGRLRIDGRCDICEEENCKHCKPSSAGNSCISCEEPYLLQDGKCVTFCKEGFYAQNNDKCVPCPQGCDKCSSKVCDNCKDGYFLHKDGTCGEICGEGFVGDCSTRKCGKCSDACLNCAGFGNDKCLECAPGYVYQGKRCVYKENCHDGFYADMMSGKCVKCIKSNCASCVNADTCRVCKHNYHLKNGECVRNFMSKPIITQPVVLTPQAIENYGEMIYDDEELGFVLQDSKDISIIIGLKSLGATRYTKETSYLTTVDSKKAGVKLEFVIDRTDEHKCGVYINYKDNTYKALGGDCSDAALSDNSYFISTVSTNGNGNVHASIYTYTHNILNEKTIKLTIPGLKVLGDENTKVTVTNQSMAITQAVRVSSLYLSSSVISKDAVNTIVQQHVQESTFSCRYNNSCGHNEKSKYIIVSNAYNPAKQALKLKDSTIVKINDFVSESYTVESLSYNINDGYLISVKYPYENSKIEKEPVAIAIKTDSKATTSSEDKGVITIPSINTNDKWVKVMASVNDKTEGTVYRVIVKSAETGKVVYNTELNKQNYHNATKLQNDAIIVSDASTYGSVITLSPNAQEVLSTINHATKNLGCKVFNENGVCMTCNNGFELDLNNKCVSSTNSKCKEILDYQEVFSNKAIEIDVEDELAESSKVAFLIRFRKITHSVTNAPSEHNIVSVRSGNTVVPLLKEVIKPDYTSEYKIGDKSIQTDYTKQMKEIKFFIQTSSNGTAVATLSMSDETNGVLGTSYNIPFPTNVQRLILGDNTKSGINTSFSLNLACHYEMTDDEKTNLIKTNAPRVDPACLQYDMSTGKCLECLNKSSADGSRCSHAVLGFKEEAVTKYTPQNVNVDEQYVYKINSDIPDNVNSDSYAVVSTIVIHKAYESAEIINLTNESIPHGSNGTPLNILSINLVKNGEKQGLEVVINTAKDGKITTPLNHVDVKSGSPIQVFVYFNTNDNSVSITTKTQDVGEKTVTVDLHGPVEELQSNARLALFGFKSSHQAKIIAEVVHTYLLPNLHADETKQISTLFFNDDKFKYTAHESVQGCQYVSQSGACLKCSIGFEKSGDKCVDSTLVHSNAKSYRVVSQEISTGPSESYSLSPEFSNENGSNLTCHVKMNYVKYESDDNIIQAGDIKLNMVTIDGTVKVNFSINSEEASLGPFKPEDLLRWVAVTFQLGSDKSTISLRDSRSGDLIDSASINKVLNTPESLIINNSDQSVYVANCYQSKENYAEAVINAPEDKNIHCDSTVEGECLSSEFGVKTGIVNNHEACAHNFAVVDANAPYVIDIESLIMAKSGLSSQEFSFGGRFALLKSNVSEGSAKYINLFTFRYGHNNANFFSVKQNKKETNSFSIENKTLYSELKGSTKDIEVVSLPNELQNAEISIVVSVKKGSIDIIIFDSAINYIQHKIEIIGTQDKITPSAYVEFGEKSSESDKAILIVKSYCIDVQYAKDMTTLFDSALEINSKLQGACKHSDDIMKTCTECEEGFKIVTDNNGDEACVPTGSSFAFNMNEVISVHSGESQFTDFNVSDKIENLFLSFNVHASAHSKKSLLLSLGTDSSILEVFVSGSNLIVNNLLAEKETVLENVFDCTKGKTFSNVVCQMSIDGSTKVTAYDLTSGDITSNTSFGKSTDAYAANKLRMTIGGQNEIHAKFGAVLLNVNAKEEDQISTDKIKLLAVRPKNQENCFTELSDGYEICSKKPQSDISVEYQDKLYTSLDSLVTDFTNTKQLHKLVAKLNIDVKALSESESTNKNVLFVLDNNVPSDVYENYKKTDILSENIDGSCKLSVTINNDRLILNTPSRDIELLDQIHDVSSYKNIDVKFAINTDTQTISVVTTADDLTIKAIYNTPEIEGVYHDTKVYKNDAIKASLNFNENYYLTEKIDCESFKIEQDHCNIDNCLGCFLNQQGFKYCHTCATGFNNVINATVCTANEMKPEDSFISGN